MCLVEPTVLLLQRCRLSHALRVTAISLGAQVVSTEVDQCEKGKHKLTGAQRHKAKSARISLILR